MILVLASTGACVRNIGARAADMPVATSAAGTYAEIRLRKDAEWLKGELLDVRDDAFVVLNGGRVTVVPFTTVDRATFRDSMLYLDRRDALSPGEISELRLVSRFPSGISPTVMARLLAAYGQTQPVVIAR
jgi:hypothetical protein